MLGHMATGSSWDDALSPCHGRSLIQSFGSSGGRPGIGVRLCDGCVLGRPARLCVDACKARAAALAPGTRDLVRGAAEVGDHLAGSAAGHTLPRLMGVLCLILVVAGFAGHEPMRLAFPA